MRRLPLGLLALALLLPSGSVAEPDPYAVSFWSTTYRDLPLPGGGPLIWIYPEGSIWIHGDSQDAQLPFPIRFYDRWYSEASAASSGYLSFGSVAMAKVPGSPNFGGERVNFSIPPVFYDEGVVPNRIIALWWDALRCGPSGSIRSQILGEAPHRQYVIEWRRCVRYNPAGPSIGTLNMQLWLTEGSDTLEVRYGRIEEGPQAHPFAASVGVMSPLDEETVVGTSALPCTPNCGVADWVEDRVILYSQEADLSVEELQVEPVGYANLRLQVEGTVKNLGVRTAQGFRTRLWLSPSPELSEAAIALQDTAAAPAISTEMEHRFVADPLLPLDLEPGERWLIAEVNPDGVVSEATRRNNLASQKVLISPGIPDLAVGAVSAPTTARAGETVSIQWQARNVGGAGVESAAYSIHLTTDETVGVFDPLLATGTLDIGSFSSQFLIETIELPIEVPQGIYRVGVILDPDQEILELDERNNDRVSGPMVVEGSGQLQVLTDRLPPAELGAPYCKLLEARGGSGVHEWSLVGDSELPPGLSLEQPRGQAAPGTASLCGRPSRLGHFSFEVVVRSDGLEAAKRLELEVSTSGQALTAATADLPVATFAHPYLAHFGAVGGSPPYTWRFEGGALPPGLRISSDGELGGIPAESGSFGFMARLEDSAGTSRVVSLRLLVAGPGRLSCPVAPLPPLSLGEPVEQRLEALGGRAPFRWRTRSTTRLSRSAGEQSRLLGEVPVPGLELSEGGLVAGTPTSVGTYRWMVELGDSLGAEAICSLIVEVGAPGGITVVTTGLPPAIVGRAYAVDLQAAGGIGALHWSLHQGSRLPPGLELSEGGRVQGRLEAAALRGEAEADVSVVVEVHDQGLRRGVGAVTIPVFASAPAPPVADDPPAGGCAASGGPAFLWSALLLASLPLGPWRTRRR